MCVTTTTQSRSQVVSFPATQIGVTPSLLSQRLMGTFGPCETNFPLAIQPLSFAAPNAEGDEYINNVDFNKSRPKRRRKPQKPGKTAKLNDRHFVKHDYHDHSNDVDDENDTHVDEAHRRRGGVAISFPIKLHAVLLQVENDGLSHIVSWMPHGRCFVIHKPKEFVDLVMPKYFRQTKLTSFQRQLNLYGFQRLTRGADAGGYYHECFLRGMEFLCKKMTRTKVKGTKFKAASSPEQEPDFYRMTPVAPRYVTPHTSDEELSFDSQSSREQTLSMFSSSNVCNPEPNTFSFSNMSSQPLQPLSLSSVNSFNFVPTYSVAPTMEADRILDEAVNELFLSDAQELDTLADFVNDWDPNFGAMLEDDAQLGFMLDRLLED
jgi:hypothetical protein